MLRRQRSQQRFFKGALRHQEEDLHGPFLAHTVGPGDPLLQNGRIPGEIHIEDRIGRLEVQPCGPGIGGHEKPTGWVLLESVDEDLTLFLGQSRRGGRNPPDGPEKGFDQVQHRRTIQRKEHLAVLFRKKSVEKGLQFG